MSKHWLIIVLFISLAFNLAVMLMFSYAQIYHRPPFCPPGMKHEIGRDNDREAFKKTNPVIKKMLDDNKAEMEKYRGEFAQKRKDFTQTLTSDTLNVNKAEAAMEASLKAHENLERKLGTSLINLRKNMTPEEAKTFFKQHRDRMRHDQNRFHPRRQRIINTDNKKGDSK